MRQLDQSWVMSEDMAGKAGYILQELGDQIAGALPNDIILEDVKGKFRQYLLNWLGFICHDLEHVHTGSETLTTRIRHVGQLEDVFMRLGRAMRASMNDILTKTHPQPGHQD